ncbi:MAG: AAA family ATPase, partial [Candidatus Binataceae bacterium]
SLLNLEPEGGIVRLCERELDSMLLEAALSKHPSGLYLLAAPARIEDGELVSDQVIGAALDLMRQLFDCVIVDCGGRIDENAVAAWERSAHLFYLIDQTIAAVRGAWRFLELFGHLGVAGLEPAFILSRYQARHPLSAGRIESTLGRPLFARIPRDEATLERAQLSGRDLWETSARAPLTSAIESLSLRLSAGDGAAPEERGIVARLFSAVGAAR